MALPPNTVAVDIGFMGFNSGTWPSIIAAKLKASLEKRILPVSYVTSPKHPVQVAEWASPSGALIAYGIDYGLTGIGCVTQVGEYYHAADLPTSRLPDVDAGLCAFTAQWFGVLRNGDVDDGGRVYIEFRDAEGAVVGVRCYDSPAMYKHAFGGAGCQMYVRIPSGARKVRFGIFGQRRVGKSATSYPSFYPIGFSGYVTKPDALPPLPPVPPTPDYDPHWARVRYLLSSRNGQVESLASPAPTTHAVNGTVRHTTENSKFGDGHNIEINPTGAAANTHFINVVLNGAALQTALTFEGWFYKKGNPRNYMGITNQFGQINDSASHLRANGPVVGADAPIPLDEWFHFALCRGETGKTSCFVNGKRQQLEREAYTGGWGTTFTLGRGSTASDNSSWYGYMDEVRLTEGVIRYTDDFVPQSNRFPTRDTTTPSSNSIKLSGDETGREKLSGDTSDGDDVLEISGD